MSWNMGWKKKLEEKSGLRHLSRRMCCPFWRSGPKNLNGKVSLSSHCQLQTQTLVSRHFGGKQINDVNLPNQGVSRDDNLCYSWKKTFGREYCRFILGRKQLHLWKLGDSKTFRHLPGVVGEGAVGTGVGRRSMKCPLHDKHLGTWHKI